MSQILKIGDSEFEEHFSNLCENDVMGLPFLSFLNTQYQKEYMESTSFQDCSFVVLHDGKPALGAMITLEEYEDTKRLSAYGRPIFFLRNKDLNPVEVRRAEKAFRKAMEDILSQHSDVAAFYVDFLNDGGISVLGDYLLNTGYMPVTKFYQILDLEHDESTLRRLIRDSYRSLISWGCENTELVIKDAASITSEDFDAFRALHIREAGRETRSPDSWNTQLKQVQNNEAFCVFSYYEDELVSAAFFLYSPRYCYYGVSASRRDMFDKPLSHAVLWQAICHAKTLGCEVFEMGDIIFPSDTLADDPKMLGISRFKRGFGGNIATKIEFQK